MVKGLPSIRKRFFDLVAAPSSSSPKRLLLRSFAAALSLLSLGPPPLPVEAASPPSQAVVIENRNRRSPVAKLVLRLGNARRSMLASHGSHSSHASHASHSSHSSHASHYSSASSPSPAAPAPSGSTTSAEPAQPEVADPAHQVRIEITTIDRQKRKLTGKDEYGTEFVFSYEPQLRIRSSVSGSIQIERHVESASTPFPLHPRQHVTVTWRPAGKTRMAVLITTE